MAMYACYEGRNRQKNEVSTKLAICLHIPFGAAQSLIEKYMNMMSTSSLGSPWMPSPVVCAC